MELNMTKKLTWATVWLLATLLVTIAQTPQSSNAVTKQLNKNRPSIYLTFEKVGGRKERVKTKWDKAERLSIRLHNNSQWPIIVEADGEFTMATLEEIILADGGKGYALPESSEVELCYDSELITQSLSEMGSVMKIPDQTFHFYSCKNRAKRRGRGNVWIRSGNSLVFSVPREFLAENLKISTVFNYEWESELGQMKADEPSHHVYFYSTDLPNRSRLSKW